MVLAKDIHALADILDLLAGFDTLVSKTTWFFHHFCDPFVQIIQVLVLLDLIALVVRILGVALKELLKSLFGN